MISRANYDTLPSTHHHRPSTDHGPVAASHAAVPTWNYPLAPPAKDHKKKMINIKKIVSKYAAVIFEFCF